MPGNRNISPSALYCYFILHMGTQWKQLENKLKHAAKPTIYCASKGWNEDSIKREKQLSYRQAGGQTPEPC